MQEKNTERLKFYDFNICPNTLHADADADGDAGGIAIALLHWSAGALKTINPPPPTSHHIRIHGKKSLEIVILVLHYESRRE